MGKRVWQDLATPHTGHNDATRELRHLLGHWRDSFGKEVDVVQDQDDGFTLRASTSSGANTFQGEQYQGEANPRRTTHGANSSGRTTGANTIQGEQYQGEANPRRTTHGADSIHGEQCQGETDLGGP